ncbi:AT-rich interactive domain-containing protein 1-like [Raphanus sativus]|uniref:AT-rich interactive domain-containing protein 1-like n=1 Tax=Raphanus sativus TaxID=3726 RepID=A0A9W3CT29_RAPSA|nr:AT-rich interactive domain-containing protein 1-like [Raphanus sativus]
MQREYVLTCFWFSSCAWRSSLYSLASLFRSLLESFLVEFCPADSFRPLPPMTGDGRAVDLFNLFLSVSRRGDAVSWDEVARECGLGFNNASSAKLIYVKYLDALARWLNRVGYDSVELCGVSDGLMASLKDFLCEVKRRYGTTASRELGAELKWFVSKAKRSCGDDDDDKKVDKVMRLDCSFSPGKRKRECPLETLKWLREAAKDPCDTCSIGSLPDRSKWEAYGREEPWKELLLFRASRTNTDPSCQKIWQKIQKMHPSLYEDSTGPSYNLRERLRFDGSGSASDSSSDEEDRPCARVGSQFQAEVPEWIGLNTESDAKWLGPRVWPLSKEQSNSNLLIERDPIGKGRQDPCGCQNSDSVQCVRFHINTKREKLKLELGPAFYMWCFDSMGEGTLQYWTDLELKKVKLLMASPPTLSPSFFSELKSILSSKSREEIVSYYYNVHAFRMTARKH